jgi:hypothetical protein
MPTATYTPLANVTLASATSTVTFSSIPATYRDLVVVVNGGATTNGNVRIALNSDTNDSNFSMVYMDNAGTGSFASGNASARLLNFNGFMENNLNTNYLVQIMDYSTTNKHKTYLSRSNNAANGVAAIVGRWSNTSAVTSLGIISQGSFIASTTFNLYGIIA